MTTTPTRRSPAWALTALSLVTLLPSLSISVATVGLPTIASAFGAGFTAVQWVVVAFLLATTALTVGIGRLGDLAGRRRLLTGGTALFTGATLLCGLAPDLPLLIAARALQGVGAAAMIALAIAFVGETVPPDRTGSAMGLLGTMSAVGTALGPSLGGVLIELAGWRAIFLVVAPLGLLALVLIRALPAAAPTPARGRFDSAGTALLAATLAAYALAVTVDPRLLAVAAAGLAGFVAVERRARDPLLAPALLRDRVLAAGLTTNTLVSAVMMTTLVVGPFHLTLALGLDPALVGLAMSAGPVVSAVTGVPAGRVTDRVGAPAMVLAGLGGIIAGAAVLAAMPASAGVAGYIGPLVVITAGYATFQAANNTAVMRDVPAGSRGVVSGALTLSRNLGLMTGASVMGAVFAAAAGTGDLAAAPAADVAAATRWCFAAAAVLVAVGLVVGRLVPRTSFRGPTTGVRGGRLEG
ncbi:MFS transporter [Actinokineospora sp. UTMC 2448]|uniref:MFS transporter n=1 Tax=Actinokineospora sp. UTMC 2448 TaxID=2268449 RepID=UPI00216450C7|nr:MFS transporter [Actinokineospora sp. UTMC 2448]UVS82085.1 Spectinomycin tetracycline efflux pump [Actinokineospora sp. UTMC 2448]